MLPPVAGVLKSSTGWSIIAVFRHAKSALWQESHRPGSRGAFAEASGLAPPLVADVEKHMGVSSGGRSRQLACIELLGRAADLGRRNRHRGAVQAVRQPSQKTSRP